MSRTDCRTCGGEVTAKDPARYPYCRNCHYTGIAEEDIRSEQVERFQAAFPEGRVTIDHTGGGCFWLSVRWEGEPVYYTATDGEASLPTQNMADLDADPGAEDWQPIPNGGWGYVGRYHDSEDHADYEGTAIYWEADEYPLPIGAGLTDEEVIETIKKDRATR